MNGLTCGKAAALAVVLALATSLIAAYAHVGSAPATSKQSARLWVSPLNQSGVTLSGRGLRVYGGIAAKADLSGTVVKLYKREVGRNGDVYVGKATVTYDPINGNRFQGRVPRLKHGAVVTAVWAGSRRYFPGRAWMFAPVKPRLTLTALTATQAKTRLRIDITPAQTSYGTGKVMPTTLADVQCLLDGEWMWFPGELGVMSTDGESWCVYDYFQVPAGTYTVRARFSGTTYNAASTSKPIEVVVP